jgi:hypothetical protein
MAERYWTTSEDDDDGRPDERPVSYGPVERDTPPPLPRPIERIPAVPVFAALEGEIRLRDFQPESNKKTEKESDDEDDDEEEAGERSERKRSAPKPAAELHYQLQAAEPTEEVTGASPMPLPGSLPDNVFAYPEEPVHLPVAEQATETREDHGIEDDEPADDRPRRRSASMGIHQSTVPQPIIRAEKPSEAPSADFEYPSADYTTYRPERHTQAAAAEAEDDVYQAPAAPIVPPPAPSRFPSLPTERPMPPYDYDPTMYSTPPPAEYTTAQYQAAPRLERMPAESHHHGEPLAAAVGLGLVAEHIGRKHADSRQQEQIDRLAESGALQHQEADARHLRMQEQQRHFANEQQRHAAEIHTAQAVRQEMPAPAQPVRYEQLSAPATPYALEQAPSSHQEPQRYEVARPVQPFPQAERPVQSVKQQEQVSQPESSKIEQGEPIYEEGPPLQPHQHIERTAWHSVVTERGKEVPNAILYGQEFHRQREHEILQDRITGNPTGAGVTGAGGGIHDGQPILMAPYQPQDSLQSGMTSPTLPPGPLTHIDPQHQLPPAPKKQVASNIANPLFWLMLALIIAAFFTAALI